MPICLVLMAGFLLAACGGAGQTPAPILPVTNTAMAGPSLSPQAPPASPVSSPALGNPAVATPATTGTLIPATDISPVVLKIKILSPEDNSVISTAQVEVKGEALSNTVVTLNDQIVLADEAGFFSAIIPLEEGPNVIDIVASDENGNEDNVQLTVTYDPGS